jgi:hypothetical protein
MNYLKIYENICSSPDTEGYTEKHHIIPKCIGGGDEPENIVKLSARKHFIAHALLAKIYKTSGLIHAAHMMSNMGLYNSKKYEWLRKAHAKRISSLLKGKPSPITPAKIKAWADPDRNRKIGNAHKGLKTETHMQRIIDALTGKSLSDSHKTAIGNGIKGEANGMYGNTHSAQARKRISEGNKQRIKCPYCNKVGGIAIMKRWHFDRCKFK